MKRARSLVLPRQLRSNAHRREGEWPLWVRTSVIEMSGCLEGFSLLDLRELYRTETLSRTSHNQVQANQLNCVREHAGLRAPSKLTLFLSRVLPDANRARRIALADGFLDLKKFGFAMQMGTARNVKDHVACVLGDGYKSRDRMRIGRTPRSLVSQPGQDSSFREE